MYRKLRNLANREDKRLKSEYFCNLINDSKGDSAKMWKSLKQVIPDSKSTVKEVQALKVKHKVLLNLPTLLKYLINIFQLLDKNWDSVLAEMLMLIDFL